LSENSIKKAAGKILEIIEFPHYRESIRKKGVPKRSKDKLVSVYDEIVKNWYPK
jgi:hypothetical protein